MQKISGNPEIRFIGFDDDWEQHKLGDVCSITSGVMGDALLSDGKYRLTRIETIADGVVDESKVGYTNIKPDDTYKLQKGDILYSNINSIGQMGKVAEYKGGSILYHGINLLRLSPKDAIYPDFLLYLLNTPSRRKWADTHANQAVSQASINQSLLENQDIFICSEHEQIEIGNFLTKLDNLIALHQRKCSRILSIKQAMLEKMFPQNGAKVPEIRFSGFTDDWEQRKLGDILSQRRILKRQSENYPRLAFAAGQGVIPLSERKTNNRDQLIYDEYSKKYLVTEKNDIVYNPANLKYGAIDRNKYGRGVISPIYVTFTSSEEPSFIECIVSSEKFRLKAMQFEEGTVIKRQMVGPSDLLSFVEYITTSRDEQQLIGSFFETINKLISFQQKSVKRLQDVKNFLLEKMFVS